VPASSAANSIGVSSSRVVIVGHIDSGLPSIQMPDVSTSDFGDLVGQCLGVMLVDVGALAALYRAYTQALGRVYGAAARPDFIAAVAAMAGVLVFDTLPGLFLAIARDIGQVRDVLRRADAGGALVEVHPSIQDAVDAVLTPGG
jgi:hypothetical protein